jgi:hypothetical protein
MKKVFKLSILFFMVNLCTIAEDKKNPQISTATKGQEIQFMDGKESRKLFLLENYIAEHGAKSESSAKLKSVDKKATAITNLGFVQIFKLSDPSLLENGKVSSKLNSKERYSAVYSFSGIDSDIVIPVGVIVQFKKNISASEISSFEKKYSLTGVELGSLDGKLVSYQTEKGQASLDLQNQIKNEPILEFSSIDFIQERGRK